MAVDILEGEIDPTNVLLVVPALFISIAMAFFGFQTNNLGLLAAGLVLFLLPATGLILTQLRILNSPLPFYYTALGYIVGNAVFLLPGVLANINLSLLSSPSTSYLSAALGQTSGSVTSIMNGFLAPRGENVALFSLSVILLVITRKITDIKFLQAFVAVVPTSIAFALLHGVRTPAFFLLAGGFMGVWILLMLGDDLGISNAEKYGLGGLGLTIGLHQSNNISASGGLIQYYSSILGAQPPIIYIGYLVVLIDVFLLGYVVYKTADLLAEGDLF